MTDLDLIEMGLSALYSFRIRPWFQYCEAVCPSICLPVTLLIHAWTVNIIEMPFAPYDGATLDTRCLYGMLIFLLLAQPAQTTVFSITAGPS